MRRIICPGGIVGKRFSGASTSPALLSGPYGRGGDRPETCKLVPAARPRRGQWRGWRQITMTTWPPASPTSQMVQMCGWFSCEASRASRTRRVRAVSSPIAPAGRALRATAHAALLRERRQALFDGRDALAVRHLEQPEALAVPQVPRMDAQPRQAKDWHHESRQFVHVRLANPGAHLG